MRIRQRHLRFIARRFWALLFTVIISLAVVVQILREAFPLLNDYRTHIGQMIGDSLNVSVSVELGRIEAVWSGMRPRIRITDIVLRSPEGDEVLSVKETRAELGVIDSLWERKLAWRQLSFDGVSASLEKSEQGRWRVRGLAELPRRERRDSFLSLQDPLDIFLIGRFVSLSNVNIDAYFPTGLRSHLNIPRIALDNDLDFHRIVAQVGVDGEKESLKLILEGHGDPRVPADFDAAGYFSIHQFPMERVLAALPGKLWQAENGAWREGHRLNLQLWFEGNYEEGLSVQGHLSAQGLPLDVPDYLKLPNSYSTKIVGQWGARRGFDLVLQDFLAQWQDFSAPKLDIRVRGKTPKYFELSTVDVADWHRVLVNMGVGKNKIGQILVSLEPKGTLQNLSVSLTDKSSGYFSLKGNLTDGSIQSYDNIPRIEQVNAVVDVNGNGGTAFILSDQGFLMGLPKVFSKPLVYEYASGRVNWQLDWRNRIAYFGSGLVTLKNQDERGRGYLRLMLPFNRQYGEPKMTLSVGVEQARLETYSDYVPINIPSELQKWLAQSVGKQGTLKNAQFLYNGSMDSEPEVDPVVQLIANVENGNLAFDSAWPPLQQVQGSLYLDNNQLDVRVKRATILNNSVNDAAVTLVDNPRDSGQALRIYGAMQSNAAAAMALLMNSPIRETLGSALDDWQLDGQVSARLKLLVPLESDARGMHQQVNVDFSQASIDMPSLELQFEDVNGSFEYNSDSGIHSQSIHANVWGRPVEANIESPMVAGAKEAGSALFDTQINFRGDVDVADVKRWSARPELEFMQGIAPVEGRLIIPADNTQDYDLRIQMNSSLEGLAFNLPAPFTKAAELKKLFSIDLKLYQDYEAYEFNYDNHTRLRLIASEDAAKEAVHLSFGATHLDLKPGYFDVVGALPPLDVFEWDTVYDQYFEYVDQMTEGGSEEPSLPVRLDLDIAACALGNSAIENVNVSGFGNDERWQIDIASAALSGQLTMYADETLPVVVDLDYLRIPDDEASREVLNAQSTGSQPVAGEDPPPIAGDALPEEAAIQGATDTLAAIANNPRGSDPLPKVPQEVVSADETKPAPEESFLADIDLASVLPVDFKVKELSYAGKYLGNWRFNLRPFEGGVKLHNINGDARGVHVNESAGGEFTWLQDDRGNRSAFVGNIKVDRGGEVLEAWDYERILDAKSTDVEVKVSWDGAPDELALDNIKGDILFSMTDGNFIRGAQQGENPLLRLIALFNFDTIARRLRLDFSDLAKEGFAFDQVSAEFEFADGKIFLHDPVIVDSSSSKMQLAGIVDVISEEIDAQLVVTLPVAGDLTIATALVAGLPAAVGVFVVSKIFRKQVDKASSINYQVSGAWVDPKIKFKRIFDDSAARKKADEVKGRDASSLREAEYQSLGNKKSKFGHVENQIEDATENSSGQKPVDDIFQENPALPEPAKLDSRGGGIDERIKPPVKVFAPGDVIVSLEGV